MAVSLDIVGMMDLLGPWFDGPTWGPWRAVLKAAFALPMSDAETVFFRSIADRDPPARRVKELWVVAGRRAGKDSVASLIAAHAAVLFDQQGKLRPGERAAVLCLACDRDQARIVLNYVRSYFTSVPVLKAGVRRETADGFELKNGIDVVVATNSFRSTRGRTILAAILDECAFYRSDTSAMPDTEVYRALVPGTATLSGSMLIGISSPYRRAGLLYQKFRDHYGKAGDILVIRAPTTALNPTIDAAIIDQALDEDPAAARAEWLGEFRDDIAGFADVALIEAAVDRGVTLRPPRPGTAYVSFVDVSGGVRDSCTCAVAHAEDGVAVLDNLLEIRAPFNPTSATAQVANTLKAYRLCTTTGDKYAAQWVVDAFAKLGIRYEHSERDRSSLYLDALPLFTSGRARLLDNKRLVTQFASLERRTSPVGKDRVDHGPGGHDDLCNSAAGAMVLATSGVAAIDWRGLVPGIIAGLRPYQGFGRAGRQMPALADIDTRPPRSWDQSRRGLPGEPS